MILAKVGYYLLLQLKIAPGLAYYKSGKGWFNQKVWHTRASFLTKGNVTVALKNYTHGERLCDSAIIIMYRYVLLLAFKFISKKKCFSLSVSETNRSKYSE